MSDSQSKDNDKNTKRGRWISSGSQNVEALWKTHGSGGTSSKSDHRRRKEITRQRHDKPSRNKDIDQAGLDGASVPCNDGKPKKRVRSQLKSVPKVCCPKDNTGTNVEDMNLEEIIVQKIDKAEFRNNKKCFVTKPATSRKTIDSMNTVNAGDDSDDSGDTAVEITEVEFKSKKTHNELKIGPLTRRKMKDDNNCGLASSSVAFRNTDQGNDDDDTDPGADYFESIDESEFRKIERHFLSKIGTSTRQKVNEKCSAAISGENVIVGNKKISAENKDECRMKRADPEMSLGVASRTRSKTTMIQKRTKVGKVSFDLSDESSSSTDSGYDSSDNDFEVNSNCSDSTDSCSHVPSAEIPMFTGNKEGTSYERNRVPEDNAVINTIPGGDANADEDFNVIEKLPKSVMEPFTQEDRNGEGVNVPKQTPENLFKRKRGSSKHNDFFRKLADSVLERGPILETEETNTVPKQTPEDQNQSPLPLKFRFEDEVPEHVEKTDYEKYIEGLFAAEFWSTLEEPDSLNYSEVDQEREKSPVRETQDARCAKGQHDFVYEEDAGVICKNCLHEEVGPKDVMPEWAKSTRRGSNRKRSPREEDFSQFDDEIHLAASATEQAAFNSNSGTVWNIKPGMRDSMYKHQQEGFEFLWMNLAGSINLVDLKSSNLSTEVGGCIISHAPGTGKTRLTIVFIETYLKLFPNCRPVIIAPASMLLTWEEEFKKWHFDFPFHNLNNLELLIKENKTSLDLLAGAKRQNKDVTRMMKIYSWNKGGSILGISYSLFEKLTGEKYVNEKKNKGRRASIDRNIEDLRKILLEKPGVVVLDEGHTPRNRRSNIWNALLKLQTSKRIILSGTPFQNNFAELFNTLRLVRPAIADVLVQEKAFCGVITSKGSCSRTKSDPKNSQSASSSESMNLAVEKLKAAMSPFVHVHKGTILQENLPGLRDCVILLKPPALQRSLIEMLEGSKTTFEVEHQVALISVHPYLFRYFKSTEKKRLGIELDAVHASRLNPNDGVKTKFILELVRLSVAMHEKVLIFSQYIHPLELIKEQLSEVFTWIDGKQVLLMKGKLDQKQRQILINTFNDPLSEAKVMLASTRCCSEGISLVGASRVVLLDVVWNPSVERQAISRAYRIGQKKFVHTYHLMTSGTSEADKYCRQVEKERLSELVFCSSSNVNKELSTAVIEDRILDGMVSHVKLKDMFEKIINQPKDTDLIRTFGLT